jgi:hypothetical protein
MLHIDIWADFGCPACYLAKPRIDQAIAASGHADAITVTYRSLKLFPDAAPEPFDSFEHVLHKFGGDQAQAARLEEHMAALARAQGQPYAIHHPVASTRPGTARGSVPLLCPSWARQGTSEMGKTWSCPVAYLGVAVDALPGSLVMRPSCTRMT